MDRRRGHTAAPGELLTTPEELAALRELEHHDEPASRQHNLQQARALHARLAGADELTHLPQLDPGDCDQCHQHVHTRHRYGRYELCRTCTLSRIHAGRTRSHELQPSYLQPPTDPEAWIRLNHHRISNTPSPAGGRGTLDQLLDDWQINGDQRTTLLALHAHLTAHAAQRTAADDRWLASLAPAGEGRCDRCHRHTDRRWTVGDRALCRQHTLDAQPDDERKEAA